MTDYRETLRSLALNDEDAVRQALAAIRENSEAELDAKVMSLVRLGALLSADAAPSSYQANVEAALAAGATIDEVVATLVAVAPVIGSARVVSAAPELALALGYDVDAALEANEGDG
ncbi:MAG: carboxymuconolactone decarboxylase family protein [Solirubrobacterales bacterium]